MSTSAASVFAEVRTAFAQSGGGSLPDDAAGVAAGVIATAASLVGVGS